MSWQKQNTLARIRQYKQLGFKPRISKKPPRHPDHIVQRYFNQIRTVCDTAKNTFHAYEAPRILHLLTTELRAQDRLDANGKKEALALIDKTARRVVAQFRPAALHNIARQFGEITSDFQKEQLDRQVRSAISVPLSAIEKPVTAKLDQFAQRNVELIKTLPQRYFERVKQDVQEAFEAGTHPEDLAESFADDYEISLTDARRIARDQIGKLNGELNAERQQALGCETFIWRCVNDQRVREEHKEWDGQEFSWDDLPIEEASGEPVMPGQPIQCRCYAEIVIP